MKAKHLGALFVVLLCGAVLGQQPNTSSATMTISGTVPAPPPNPPFPLLALVPTNSITTFTLGGAPNQPYAIYQAIALSVGAASIPANNSVNSVDLLLNPFPTRPIDGFSNPFFMTSSSGNGGFGIAVPPGGAAPYGVPVGGTLALQGVVADPQ